MANNVNSNLTQRLFAYMQHKDDLTANIAKIYQNSLIFIGDQKQIYVPLYNAYVGIGMDAYDSISNRIEQVEQNLANIESETKTGVVSAILPQRSAHYNDGFTPSLPDYNWPKLAGDLTITANGNYNPDTGFSFAHNWTYNSGTGEFIPVGDSQNTVATSGLRISYTVRTSTQTIGGETVEVPIYNQLVIDDSLTWSYMLGAYSYSLEFSRDFTNNRIETLYHDLLGIGETIYVPIAYSDLFKEDPSHPGQAIYVPGEYWYKSGDTWTQLTGEPSNGTQYYTQSTNYNNSYNINIADGIQTLKEVAYMLDQLSDGGLGKVTYVSRSEWESHNYGTALKVDNATIGTYNGTVYRVIAANGKPSSSQNSYAYYVTLDADNLGIQMAYSIAGNNAAIADLHNHIELAEQGTTTVRSTGVYNATNSVITLSQWSNKTFKQTDTEQQLAPGYIVGDVKTGVILDLAKTYLTYNHSLTIDGSDYTNISVTDINGIINDTERHLVFERVNFANGEYPQHGGTYYFYDSINSKMTYTDIFSGVNTWPESKEDAIEYGANNETSMWWIPNGAICDEHVNDTFKEVDQAYKLNNPGEDYYTYTANGWVSNSNGTYILDTQGNDFVQHAIIDNSNHIATTAWVQSLISEIQSSEDGVSDETLKLAYAYTHGRIDNLDNDSKYSYAEFEKWLITTNRTITNTVGTTAYYDEKNTKFGLYVSEVNAYNDTFTGSYLNNKLKSQYISRIVESDGIVEVKETSELPTDQLEIKSVVWGSQQDDNANYVQISLPNVDIDNNDNVYESDNIQKLIAFVYNDGGPLKQVYYRDNNIQTYVKVTQIDQNGPVTTSNYGNYFVLESEGVFRQLNDAQGTKNLRIAKAFIRQDTNSAYWKQLYQLGNSYCELDLASISFDTNGNDTPEITYIDANGDRQILDLTEANISNLYVKNISSNADKKQYLTGSIKHYSYLNDGGVGQNTIDLNVNITNLEDATTTNTGFADAYDVKSFIENIFTWVNLSANVNNAWIATSPRFYKTLRLQVVANESDTNVQSNEHRMLLESMINDIISDGTKICYKQNDTYTQISNDNLTNCIILTTVSGKRVFTLGVNENPYDLYTCQQSEMINPVNMNISNLANVPNG